MSTPQRRPATGVIAQLLAAPHRFGFFQAVRLLERWLVHGTEQGPSQGLERRLRFRNSLSLGFPASEIEALRVRRRQEGTADAVEPGDVECIEVTPAFMGLLGSHGTLPLYYTETLARREAFRKDLAARAFLDIFQQRAVSLFYQAWKKHRLALQYEADRDNRFLPVVLALAGLGQAALRHRLRGGDGGVHDESLACFAGMLQQRTVPRGALRQLLCEYFGVPVEIEPFVGHWYPLPETAATRLGMRHGVLGLDAVMGPRVWQRDLRLRVVLGPLDGRTFQRFLPRGSGAQALEKLLTLLTGVTLEYEIRLRLRKEDALGVTLGGTDPGLARPVAHRLGWNTFLRTCPETRDRDDAVYEIHATS